MLKKDKFEDSTDAPKLNFSSDEAYVLPFSELLKGASHEIEIG